MGIETVAALPKGRSNYAAHPLGTCNETVAKRRS